MVWFSLGITRSNRIQNEVVRKIINVVLAHQAKEISIEMKRLCAKKRRKLMARWFKNYTRCV